MGLWNERGTLLDDLVLTKDSYRVAGTMKTDATDYSNGIVGNGVGVIPGYVRSGLGMGFSTPNEAYGQNFLHATLSSRRFEPPPAQVPEPASLGLGAGALAAVRRRVRQARA